MVGAAWASSFQGGVGVDYTGVGEAAAVCTYFRVGCIGAGGGARRFVQPCDASTHTDTGSASAIRRLGRNRPTALFQILRSWHRPERVPQKGNVAFAARRRAKSAEKQWAYRHRTAHFEDRTTSRSIRPAQCVLSLHTLTPSRCLFAPPSPRLAHVD